MSKIEWGIFDHLDRRDGVGIAETYKDRLSIIEAYDKAGFYGYHLAEHHATPLTMSPAPSVFLAAIAERTTSIHFGPMVYVLPLYHPLRLIEEICMLDQLSDGRLLLGMGRGISPIELDYYGIDPGDARDIYDEALEIIMTGLDNDTLTFEGKHFSFKDVPMPLSPYQRPHPPLWTGIGTPDGATRAGVTGHHVLTNSPLPMAVDFMQRYYDSWEETHGASGKPRPMAGVCRHTIIADTHEEAEAIMREAYLVWWESFSQLFRQHGTHIPVAQYTGDFGETVARELLIYGTAESVGEQINTYIERTGNNYFVCRFAFGSLSIEQSQDSLARFVDEVMPNFR